MSAHLTPERILQTGLGFWASKTLLSAIEMGLFTELAHGPERVDHLAGRLGMHPRSARDFFDALVALGFLGREGDRYANTPKPTCSSTGRSRRTSAASSRWRTTASIRSGDT